MSTRVCIGAGVAAVVGDNSHIHEDEMIVFWGTAFLDILARSSKRKLSSSTTRRSVGWASRGDGRDTGSTGADSGARALG